MSQEIKGITKSLNIIELDSFVDNIKGNFTYLKYETDELTSHPPEIPVGETPCRYITIKIRETNKLRDLENSYFINGVKNPILDLVEETASDNSSFPMVWTQVADPENPDIKPNVFFTQDFIKGYVRISKDNVKNKIMFDRVATDLVTATSVGNSTILDYIKQEITGNDYLDISENEYENVLSNSESYDDIIILDPNTNLPQSTTDVVPYNVASDAYISSANIEKIYKKSRKSPIIRDITQRMENLAVLISKQNAIDQNKRLLSNLWYVLTSFSTANQGGGININLSDWLAELNNPNNSIPMYASDYSESLNYNFVGWHVLKYVKNGENWTYLSSFLLPISGKTEIYEEYPGASDIEGEDRTASYKTFKDPYVLYNKTYRYEIRDAWIITTTQTSTNQGTVIYKPFLLLGTQTTNMEVTTVEKLPPPPPIGFSFDYIGDDTIRAIWQRNNRIEKISNAFDTTVTGEIETETDDIAGYIIFLRNSLEKQYRVYKQIHVRNVLDVAPSVVGFVVSSDDISYTQGNPKELRYDIEISANKDYYITYATYDVHGNISNYSEQFFFRRNNVTGEVFTQLVSARGASLAYPNSLIPAKFALSSFKSSGYKCMYVYQTPDTATSYPHGLEGSSVVSIQLIDLATEESEVIEGVSKVVNMTPQLGNAPIGGY